MDIDLLVLRLLHIFGGIFWVTSLTIAGYYLGQFEIVKNNLEAAILLIIFISILPAIITFIKARYFDPPLKIDESNETAA